MSQKSITEQESPLASTPQELEVDGLTSSPLGKLSPEVRNLIYELALTREDPFDIRKALLQPHHGKQNDDADQICCALLLSCKTINKACAQLFYAINRFTLWGSNKKNSPELLDAFSNKIGMLNARALRNVELTVNILDTLWDGHRLGRMRTSWQLGEALRRFETYTDCVFTIRLTIAKSYLPEHAPFFPYALLLRIKNGVVAWDKLEEDIDELLKMNRVWWGSWSSRLERLLLEMIQVLQTGV